jgi:hypothetical protein
VLKVKIELHSAIDGHVETLAEADIWNDVTGTMTSGNYGYRLSGKQGRVMREGRIEGFPRKRLLAADLLYRVLEDAIGSRN